MSDIIAGPGQGLPFPQALYPPSLFTTPYTAPTNQVALQAGQTLLIPAGTWIVAGGTTNPVSEVQWKDPITGQWFPLTAPGEVYSLTLRSDGFNYRVANTSGVPTGATVTAPGTGYAQATTQVTPSAGTSQWLAIVGGALGTVTITNGGGPYSVPPIVMVPAPKPLGIAAVGIAVLTSGAVTGVTWLNAGGGYGPTPPPIVFVPASPADQQLSAAATAQATVAMATAQTGVTGVLMLNAGAPAAALPTLTITGAGTGATADVLPATIVAAANDIVTIQPSSGV